MIGDPGTVGSIGPAVDSDWHRRYTLPDELDLGRERAAHGGKT